MKVLVMGNMGYVGPAVCRELALSAHDEVYGFDLGLFANCLPSREMPPEALLRAQYFGDVRTVEPGELPDADAVVYLAAISNDPMGNRYKTQTMAINCQAAERIAGMYRGKGCSRFVLASSCSVYGIGGQERRNERSEVNPQTDYAQSKVQCENLLRPLACDGFKICALRFATACGYSPRLRLDLVLNDFVAGALSRGEIRVNSDGTPWRPLIHVSDMARAIHWAIHDEHPKRSWLCVNTGSDGWNVQIRDLAYATAALIPGTKVSINSNAAPDTRSYKVDFSMFNELAPDFQPEVDLQKAVIDLRDNLQRIGFRDPDFGKSALIRLNELRSLQEKGILSDNLEWIR